MGASGPQGSREQRHCAPEPTPDPPDLSAAFEHAFEAILLVDDDGRILEASRNARALVGLERETLLGEQLVGLCAPASRSNAEAAWTRLLGNPSSRQQMTLRRGDGTTREAEVSLRVDIRPGRHLALLRDLGAARGAQRNLDALRHQLAESEKMAALGILVGGVAHEIRTPLTFIANNLFLLQKELDHMIEEGLAQEQILQRVRPHVRDALSGVDRVNHLVLELRRFTRRKPGQRARIRLDEAVLGAVELFRATSRARVTLDARLEPTPTLEMDVAQVQQVVLNLLENAADASPEGGVVRLITRERDGGAQLVIEDDGPGIPPELQARVLEGFYSTKPHGTGLGLSIVRKIAEAHHAKLSLSTGPGIGTSFTLTFPAPPRPKAL